MNKYVRHNGFLCIEANLLYDEFKMVSYENYHKHIKRSKINRVRRAARNRPALIDFYSLPTPWREYIQKQLGDPLEGLYQITFTDYLKHDQAAIAFFDEYRINGKALLPKHKVLFASEAAILNTCDYILREKVGLLYRNSKTKNWKGLSMQIQELDPEEWPHKLPKTVRVLRQKFKGYMETGYEALVSGKLGNSNSEKLTADAQKWVLARWADPVDRMPTIEKLLTEYNEIACPEYGYAALESSKTLYNYLFDPAIEAKWKGPREGELSMRSKFNFSQKRQGPSAPHTLWEADGTKLNLYYLEAVTDDKGNTRQVVKTLTVYEVMDVYSETFLGYHISETENYEAQYKAFKMAIQTTGYKPVELRYDGQGGHGKLRSFFDKLVSKLHRKVQPYNGRSKRIESAFGRFQQQEMAAVWYFTGQNITAKKGSSRANTEFIETNKHKLPTREEVIAKYETLRTRWNHGAHHQSGKSRMAMLLETPHQLAQEVSMLDMVDIFWVEREKLITYKMEGLAFTERNRRYEYAPYSPAGDLDVDFHYESTGKKFKIRFDPEDFSMIYIYDKEGRFVRELTTKLTVSIATVDQTTEERERITKTIDAQKEKHEKLLREGYDTLEEFGRAPWQSDFKEPNRKFRKKETAKKQVVMKTAGEQLKADSYEDTLQDTDTDLQEDKYAGMDPEQAAEARYLDERDDWFMRNVLKLKIDK